MKYKNRYLYYSILPCLLFLIAIGVYVSGYNPPTANPPFDNLPAPINAGPDPQIKEGGLTIQGDLIADGIFMLGRFASAPDRAEGALYFNTADKAIKVYSDDKWNDLGGGGSGLIPSYTTAQRNALSLVNGLIVYNTTDNAVQIYVSAAWRNVGAKLSLTATCSLDGDCDSTHCADGVCCDLACSETDCQTCGSLSSNGIGHCGYVNSSSNDPRNICTTASPGAADSCKGPNCNGTGYACSYLAAGEQSQPICKRCSGSSYNPVNIANATQDAEGSNLCTATHYRCDGSGNCTAPQGTTARCLLNVGSCTPTCSPFGCLGTYQNSTCTTLSYSGCYYGPPPGNPLAGYCKCSAWWLYD